MYKIFKIKPNYNESYFFEVKYFNNHKSMIKECRKTNPTIPEYRAIFSFYTNNNKLGEIYLCKKYDNIYTIMHECNHATFHYFRLIDLKFCTRFHDNPIVEELFCYIHQTLVAQILSKINKVNTRFQHLQNYKKGAEFYRFPILKINETIKNSFTYKSVV